VKQFRPQAVPQVQSTLAKLSLCRTAALGGHRWRCSSCEHECTVYNSCGDRHCPQCSGAKRADWLKSTSELLLEGVDYHQVVFTIPSELSSLTLGNRWEMCNLLFQSAWQSLKNVVEDEQGFEVAAGMVLHTWNQHLDAHFHVHAFVPGGGPSLEDPEVWKSCTPPKNRPWIETWLVDADELRDVYRTTFLKGLRRLQTQGKLNLEGEWSYLQQTSAFESWLKPLESITWVAYIQPPPTKNSTPEQFLKYLARYLTGGPISERRLVSHESGQVTFTARKGTTTGGSDELEEVTVSGVEFVRRWSLHIHPKGYTKTRRYGGFSHRHRQRYLEQCGKLLSKGAASTDNPADERSDDVVREHLCPQCESIMSCVDGTDRPGWKIVMASPHRPMWYDDG